MCNTFLDICVCHHKGKVYFKLYINPFCKLPVNFLYSLRNVTIFCFKFPYSLAYHYDAGKIYKTRILLSITGDHTMDNEPNYGYMKAIWSILLRIICHLIIGHMQSGQLPILALQLH